MKNIRKKMENKGFTLVEIIVCLAIRIGRRVYRGRQ